MNSISSTQLRRRMAQPQPAALAPQRDRQPCERVDRRGARLDTAEVADQGMSFRYRLRLPGRAKLIGGTTDEFSFVDASKASYSDERTPD